MKFITVVSLFLLGLNFSLSAAVPIPSQPIDIDRVDEKDHSQSRNLRGRPSPSSDIYNPNGCPAASRMQMLGNQCTLQGQRTLCCVQTRSGAWHSWVQCSSRMCSGPNNAATSFIAADFEDFGSEATYGDSFGQQQLEQNDDTTKSLHQKSGAGSTDPVVTREGTRDRKPQSTEDWCKQYAAEPRCQTNNYCIANNLCTNPTTF